MQAFEAPAVKASTLVPPAGRGLVRLNVPEAAPVTVPVLTKFAAVLDRVSVTTFEFAESPIVIVGSVLDAGKKVKVPEAVSNVALVCRASPFDVPLDEFVIVIVWVLLFGAALKVPTTLPWVALVDRVSAFEFLVMVSDVVVKELI